MLVFQSLGNPAFFSPVLYDQKSFTDQLRPHGLRLIRSIYMHVNYTKNAFAIRLLDIRDLLFEKRWRNS